MKLADLVLTNYRLLYVFPCFGIELGIGERTVKQVCDEKGISISLFLLVCNVYTFDDYVPETNALVQIPLADLTGYLRNSHKDYLENRMPKIIDRILDLHVEHGEMLSVFCKKYRQEVITHFDYEEQIVFPYITALLKGEKPNSYKIKEYESNHSDLDAALSDLKNILIKYLPKEFTLEMCRDVLIDLFLFESDLSKHTLLEDQILISLVERIENSVR
jgi:regulator of cell morphogenesis and NO signaling